MELKSRLLAAQAAALEDERRAGAARMAAKQVGPCRGCMHPEHTPCMHDHTGATMPWVDPAPAGPAPSRPGSVT